MKSWYNELRERYFTIENEGSTTKTPFWFPRKGHSS